MKLEKYNAYSVEDYLEDPVFRQWVLNPDPKTERDWEAVFVRYPNQKIIANQARSLLLELKDYFQNETLQTRRLDDDFVRQLRSKMEEQPVVARIAARRIHFRKLSVAASLLLLIGVFSWLWLGRGSDDLQIYATQYGERKTVELPDGSIVALNAHSTLKTARKWKKGEDRLVWLTGEAHFTIRPQPATQARFTVITNDLSVNVLGTVFNVRARTQGTQVTLEEGRVSLELKEKLQEGTTQQQTSIVMQPGEQVRFSARTQQLEKSEKVNVVAKSSWKDGVLIFERVTLKELGMIITETFGYPVTFRDTATMHQLITGSVPAENDLDLLLETVEEAFQLTIVQKDSLLIFE